VLTLLDKHQNTKGKNIQNNDRTGTDRLQTKGKKDHKHERSRECQMMRLIMSGTAVRNRETPEKVKTSRTKNEEELRKKNSFLLR